jgi:hypothetical protein
MTEMKSPIFATASALLLIVLLELAASNTVSIECTPRTVGKSPETASGQAMMAGPDVPTRFACAADGTTIAFLNEFAVLDTLMWVAEELHVESHASYQRDDVDELESFGDHKVTVFLSRVDYVPLCLTRVKYRKHTAKWT